MAAVAPSFLCFCFPLLINSDKTVCMIRKRKGADMVTPIQIQSSSTSRPSSSTLRRLPVFLIAAGGALVVLLLLIMSNQTPSEEQRHSGMKTTPEVIVQDTVKGVDYYHCSAEKTWTGVSSFVTRHTGTTRNVCPHMKCRYLMDIGFSSFESSLHDDEEHCSYRPQYFPMDGIHSWVSLGLCPMN